MSLSQLNLPISLNRSTSRFLSALWSAQDTSQSPLGLLMLPEYTRQYRSFYCCYMECFPLGQGEWAISSALSGPVIKRQWQVLHVMGLVKYPKPSALASLGGDYRAKVEHRLVAWQQHLTWLLARDTMHAEFCKSKCMSERLQQEGIEVTLPPLIGCAGSEHIKHILAPATFATA